uniref:Uncharacterized protein n=1 Tax=Pararge aegeria TaxID=116150 RepID=S4PVZ8_9NEOP
MNSFRNENVWQWITQKLSVSKFSEIVNNVPLKSLKYYLGFHLRCSGPPDTYMGVGGIRQRLLPYLLVSFIIITKKMFLNVTESIRLYVFGVRLSFEYIFCIN